MSDRARTLLELERTFKDVTDPGYHTPLEQEGEGLGWDAVVATAAPIARASDAVHTNSQAFYLLPHSRQTGEPASGAQKASTTVRVRRRGAAGIQLRIPAGKRLLLEQLDSRGQLARLEAYELAEQLELDVGSPGPVDVRAQAVRVGDQANLQIAQFVNFALEGARTVSLEGISGLVLTDTGAPDVFTAGDVGRYLLIAGEYEPRRVLSYSQDTLGRGQVTVEGDAITGSGTARLLEWAELGVTLEQLGPFTGGRHATLDQIGRERGMPRAPGEGDLDYAYRVSSLPDIISPASHVRICARDLSPLGIAFAYYEARELGLRGFVLDDTPLDAATVCTDDLWSGAILLSASAQKRFFLVCVEASPNLGGTGLPFDALNAGLNAYDVGEAPADGIAEDYQNAILKLDADLNAARAGGVTYKIVEHAPYVPYAISTVELDVTMALGTSPYLDVRDASIAAHLALLAVGESTSEAALMDVVAAALLMAGLDPTGVFVFVSGGSLVPDPHGKLVATFV